MQTLGDARAYGYDPTSKQREAITKRMGCTKNSLTFGETFTDKFVSDKFGEATTHWRKLFGLSDSIVKFHEEKAALVEVEAVKAEGEPA